MASVGGAFLYLQWARMRWPVPDYILYVPARSGSGWWWQNHACLLAKALGERLRVPVRGWVKRGVPAAAQKLQRAAGRMALTEAHFTCRPKRKIMGKCVLVVDDVITTGATLACITAVLKEAGARQVYGLGLARA